MRVSTTLFFVALSDAQRADRGRDRLETQNGRVPANTRAVARSRPQKNRVPLQRPRRQSKRVKRRDKVFRSFFSSSAIVRGGAIATGLPDLDLYALDTKSRALA
jgi:hypothetical protein